MPGVNKASVTADWPHLRVPACVGSEAYASMYDGLVCDSTVQLRRMMVANMQPFGQLQGQPLMLARGTDTSLVPFQTAYPANGYSIAVAMGACR